MQVPSAHVYTELFFTRNSSGFLNEVPLIGVECVVFSFMDEFPALKFIVGECCALRRYSLGIVRFTCKHITSAAIAQIILQFRII